MVKRSQKEIIGDLVKQGYVFTKFTLSNEGYFTISDADWNYKDVPHLTYIHELVEGVPATIGDDSTANIFLQKILGFRFPLSIFNYESGKNRQTYFTCLFMFVLIIETSYEDLGGQSGTMQTRVNTTYAIGSTPLWRFAFPIIRFLLKRNYKNLMSGDIPMRERRGQLRSWGYTFKGDNSSYSFRKTMEILEANVIPPEPGKKTPFLPRQTEINVNHQLVENQMHHFGRSDEFGLQILKKEGTLFFFPRLCPHEGACLDVNANNRNVKFGETKECKVQCPWHGRTFKSILKIDLSNGDTSYLSQNHKFTLSGDILTISVVFPAMPAIAARAATDSVVKMPTEFSQEKQGRLET